MIRKLKEQKFVWMWGSLLALLLLAAAFPQFLASHDPELADLGNKLQGASRAYPLGTDHMGRCVLCRLLYGAHTSLFVAGATVLITAFTGTVIGMVSGYYGGIADTLLMRLTDVFLGFYVFNAFLQFVIGYIGHTTGAQIEADIRQELFEHIQELSFSFFDRNKVGELMAHMRSDLYELTELAHHGPEDLYADKCRFFVGYDKTELETETWSGSLASGHCDFYCLSGAQNVADCECDERRAGKCKRGT